MSIAAVSKRMELDERGYFAFPLIEEDLLLDDFDEWSVIADYVQAAKAGCFDALTALLSLYDRDANWVRRYVYEQLLGDAGTDAVNEQIHGYLRAGLPADYSWGFAGLLYRWGRLDIVPSLAHGWRAGYVYQDAEDIPPRLSLLLEEEGPIYHDYPSRAADGEADAYLKMVLAHHAELVKTYGERAFVFRGRLLDIEWIARCGLADLAEGNFKPEMRHKFEAMTGIDCSSFYDSRGLVPLAAAAVFEAFLASSERKAFIPGQRYFFGHPVPAGDPAGAAQWPPR